MDQYFNGHYKKFKEKRSKKQFKFDECFWHYVNGDKKKFRKPWKDVEYVYYTMNINENHWILLQICFTSWDIIAYDSDMALNTNKKLEECMETICNMLPHLLLAVGFSSSQYKDFEGPMPFQCRREPPSKVPQTHKKRVNFLL